MADNVVLKDGSGTNFTVATDDLIDGTLGAVEVQFIKIMDGTLDSTNKLIISSSGEAQVKFASPQHAIIDSGTVAVSGAVDVSAATVPTNEVKAATSAVTRVAASATSVQILASAPTRKLAILFNDSTSVVYVKYGTTASTTSFTYKLNAGDTLEVVPYTGRIDAIWQSATGSMQVTELTP